MCSTFFAGQMPVKADWIMFEADEGGQQEPIGRYEIAERDGQQNQRASYDENGAFDSHVQNSCDFSGCTGTAPHVRMAGSSGSHLHLVFGNNKFKIMNVKDMIPASDLAARLMRSLSHPQRLLVLCALGNGEKSVSELRSLLGGVEQVPMSQQLMRLRADGLVESRRERTAVYYHIARPEVLLVIGALEAAYCGPAKNEKRDKGSAD